jgi:ATP-dependent Clp protease ATP-binding subunit ClpA
VGTEHLLLGLVREGEGIAAGVLESMGVNLENVRRAVFDVLEGFDSIGADSVIPVREAVADLFLKLKMETRNVVKVESANSPGELLVSAEVLHAFSAAQADAEDEFDRLRKSQIILDHLLTAPSGTLAAFFAVCRVDLARLMRAQTRLNEYLSKNEVEQRRLSGAMESPSLDSVISRCTSSERRALNSLEVANVFLEERNSCLRILLGAGSLDVPSIERTLLITLTAWTFADQ